MDTAEHMFNMIGNFRTVDATSSSIPDLLGVPQLELVRIVGREVLSELFTYAVDLRPVSLAANQSILESNLDVAIGHEITLLIELGGMGVGLPGDIGAGIREITGFVTAIEPIGDVDNSRRCRYTLCPWLWLTTRASDYKAPQNRTAIDILDEILAGYNFSVDKCLDTSVYPKLIWEVQHSETDAHFTQRLTEQWGISYFFGHDGRHHRLALISESGAWRRSPSAAYHTLLIYP